MINATRPMREDVRKGLENLIRSEPTQQTIDALIQTTSTQQVAILKYFNLFSTTRTVIPFESFFSLMKSTTDPKAISAIEDKLSKFEEMIPYGEKIDPIDANLMLDLVDFVDGFPRHSLNVTWLVKNSPIASSLIQLKKNMEPITEDVNKLLNSLISSTPTKESVDELIQMTEKYTPSQKIVTIYYFLLFKKEPDLEFLSLIQDEKKAQSITDKLRELRSIATALPLIDAKLLVSIFDFADKFDPALSEFSMKWLIENASIASSLIQFRNTMDSQVMLELEKQQMNKVLQRLIESKPTQKIIDELIQIAEKYTPSQKISVMYYFQLFKKEPDLEFLSMIQNDNTLKVITDILSRLKNRSWGRSINPIDTKLLVSIFDFIDEVDSESSLDMINLVNNPPIASRLIQFKNTIDSQAMSDLEKQELNKALHSLINSNPTEEILNRLIQITQNAPLSEKIAALAYFTFFKTVSGPIKHQDFLPLLQRGNFNFPLAITAVMYGQTLEEKSLFLHSIAEEALKRNDLKMALKAAKNITDPSVREKLLETRMVERSLKKGLHTEAIAFVEEHLNCYLQENIASFLLKQFPVATQTRLQEIINSNHSPSIFLAIGQLCKEEPSQEALLKQVVYQSLVEFLGNKSILDSYLLACFCLQWLLPENFIHCMMEMQDKELQRTILQTVSKLPSNGLPQGIEECKLYLAMLSELSQEGDLSQLSAEQIEERFKEKILTSLGPFEKLAESGKVFFEKNAKNPLCLAIVYSKLAENGIALDEDQRSIVMQSKEFFLQMRTALGKQGPILNREIATLSKADKEKIFSDPDMLLFKQNRMNLMAASNPEVEYREIYKKYQENIPRHGELSELEHNLLLDNDASIQMPGMALLCSYLSLKEHVEGLYACASTQTLQSEIRKMIDDPRDQKKVFIVGSSIARGYRDYPGHKTSICIEKKGGIIHILILDSVPGNWNKAIREKIEPALNDKCKVYVIPFQRQYSERGCPVFALRDGIAFLQDKDFLTRTEYQEEGGVRKITKLPPRCMIHAQSLTLLDEYKKEHPDSFLEEKKGKSLQKTQQKHQVEENGKKQNRLVTNEYLKRQHILACCSKHLPAAQLQAMVDHTLLL